MRSAQTMSNILYNFSQKEGYTLTKDDCNLFKSICDQYDSEEKELNSLRSFAKKIVNFAIEGEHRVMPIIQILVTARMHILIDENCNPTKLLTGE